MISIIYRIIAIIIIYHLNLLQTNIFKLFNSCYLFLFVLIIIFILGGVTTLGRSILLVHILYTLLLVFNNVFFYDLLFRVHSYLILIRWGVSFNLLVSIGGGVCNSTI